MTGALQAPRLQGALFLAQSGIIPLRSMYFVLNRRHQDFSRFFQKKKRDALPTSIPLGMMKWCGAELNRRHQDFQSCALPTELPHQCFQKRTQR